MKTKQDLKKASKENKKSFSSQKNTSHPVARGAFVVTAIYAGLRLSVAAFHRFRRRNLRALLFAVCDALDQSHATYWLDFGGLLGITRDQDLILYDNDIDLAVLDPDWEQLLPKLKERLEPKYRVKVVTPAAAEGSPWIRVYCPGGMCDLFNAFSEDPNMNSNAQKVRSFPEVHASSYGGQAAAMEYATNFTSAAATAAATAQNENENSSSDHREEESYAKVFVGCGHGDTMHISKYLVLPPRALEWQGQRVMGPADVAGVLEWRYGADWKIPKYMDKGADTVEGSKLYAKVFRALAAVGIKI